MNKFLFNFRQALSLVCLLPLTALAQQEESYIPDEMQNIIHAERKVAAGKQNFAASTFTANYDIRYHRLQWNVNPSVYAISGSVTTHFVPKSAGFNEINFDMEAALQVDSVRFNGQKITAFQELTGDRLKISLPSTRPENQLDTIVVYYKGTPTATGFGSFIQDSHAGQPVLWTLSEPYGAKEWWPCKQSLNDKIDSIDVLITTSSQYRAASNGLLVDSIVDGTNKTYHWKHKYPIAAYLVAFAVTNYSSYAELVPLGSDTTIQLNYVYPENLASAKAGTAAGVPMIQLYSNMFGIYPFHKEKYGHAQFGWGGGMEHQTMSFMVNFSFGLVAHELAHQWFGDKITCGTWAEIWLNEGFATYCEGLAREKLQSAASWNSWKANTMAGARSNSGSVYVNDTTSVDRIFSGTLTYNKGAMILHMLRWKVGDSAFFAGMKNYATDPILSYSYARSSQFKAHIEAASGQNLTEFFNDWLYGRGFPSYDLEYSQNANKVLTINLGQTTTSTAVPFFEMPVQIRVVGTSGEDTLIRLNHTVNNQIFDINLPFVVEDIEFDPNIWLLQGGANITVGTKNNISRSMAKLYPNPAKNQVLIALEQGHELEGVKLTDVSGRVCLTQTNTNETLNIEALPSGLYFVEIQTNKGFITKKLVKE